MAYKPTVSICGCAKDCAEYIDDVFDNIKKLSKIFIIKHIYISYDDSSDNTLEILLKHKKIYDIMKILGGTLEYPNAKDDGTLRVLNICNARNRYMAEIITNPKETDFFIVMDMDDVCSSPINIDYIDDMIKDCRNWDGLTFDNSRYYDFWALSIRPLTLSCFMANDNKKHISLLYNKLNEERLKDTKYIDCESAFNGFGIYKTRFYKLFYTPYHSRELHKTADVLSCLENYELIYPSFFENKKHVDCEHRSFHMNAKINNGARLKIAKNQIFDDYKGDHCLWLYDSGSTSSIFNSF